MCLNKGVRSTRKSWPFLRTCLKQKKKKKVLLSISLLVYSHWCSWILGRIIKATRDLWVDCWLWIVEKCRMTLRLMLHPMRKRSWLTTVRGRNLIDLWVCEERINVLLMACYRTREKPDIFTKKGKKKCQEILNVSLQKLISWCNTRSSNRQPVNMIPTYNKKDAGVNTTLLKVTKPLT